jgi:hypothetical protein
VASVVGPVTGCALAEQRAARRGRLALDLPDQPPDRARRLRRRDQGAARSRRRRQRRVDLPGTVTLMIAMIPLLTVA